MITAPLTQQPDGSLLLEHPNVWEARTAASRRSFIANVRGRRLEVFVGMIESKFNIIKIPIYYFNNYRDAEDFDEPVGQNVIASDPTACVKWIKSYTPRGPEQELIIEFFSWLSSAAYMERRQATADKEIAQWEEDRRIELAAWYAKEEARMNAEAAALEEPQFPMESQAETKPVIKLDEDG